MMWPFHSTSDSHGLPDFVCDLIQRANQRRSNAIKGVGGGCQTQQGYGGTGVRGSVDSVGSVAISSIGITFSGPLPGLWSTRYPIVYMTISCYPVKRTSTKYEPEYLRNNSAVAFEQHALPHGASQPLDRGRERRVAPHPIEQRRFEHHGLDAAGRLLERSLDPHQ